MITKETMQQILEEEKYRQEVKKSLEPSSSPSPKQKGKAMEFLNSTFFLALLSSVLIPIIINNFQSRAQKEKEMGLLKRKIASERAEIINRIDIITSIDTSGITGDDYLILQHAFKGGFDSSENFSLNNEFAKRNIESLLSDYEFDLRLLESKNETDSIISKIPIILNAIKKSKNYVFELEPNNYDKKAKEFVDVDEKIAKKNPKEVELYFCHNNDLNEKLLKEIFPELRKFH